MVAVAVMTGALVLMGASTANADTEGHWWEVSDWTFSPPASTAAVAVPGSVGFPAAELVSNTAGPSGPATGASAWLGAWTAPGEVYGSSQNQQYLSLRPAANNAASPSTSTYTFEHPTPAGGWMLAVGDIDAEFLDVSALDADGAPVPISELGFGSTFNYCDGSPRPSTCGASRPWLVPDWDSTTGRLAGPSEDENGEEIPGWTDSDGAAAWFEPTVSLSQITVTATWREGFPAYQTWSAALSRDVTGTVGSADACEVEGLEVTIRRGTDDVATTTTDDQGQFGFDDLATYDDYVVTIEPGEGCRVVGPTETAVDLSENDGVVNVELETVPDDEGPGTGEPGDDAPAGQDGSRTSGAGTVPATQVLPDVGAPSSGLMGLGVALVLLGLLTLAVGLGVPPSRRRTPLPASAR